MPIAHLLYLYIAASLKEPTHSGCNTHNSVFCKHPVSSDPALTAPVLFQRDDSTDVYFTLREHKFVGNAPATDHRPSYISCLKRIDLYLKLLRLFVR